MEHYLNDVVVKELNNVEYASNYLSWIFVQLKIFWVMDESMISVGILYLLLTAFSR